MPLFLPISDFFNITDFATPATYVNAAGTRKDIEVVFEKSYIAEQNGISPAANEVPVAFCKTSDVIDFSKGAKLILNSLIEIDDDTGWLVDHLGNLIIAEGLSTYYIVEKQEDQNGLTMLVLSEEAIQ